MEKRTACKLKLLCKWYDVFGRTLIGQMAGRLAYAARAFLAGADPLDRFWQGYCQESPQSSVVHAAAAKAKHLRAPDHQPHPAPRRHTTTTTDHSSTTASPLQLHRRSRRETPPCSTSKDQLLNPGTSPANFPYLKETQRRRPGTNRTRDTNTTSLISRCPILHAAFPPQTLRRTAHHHFSKTPRQHRQSVFHSPPAGRHLVRRKCEPVAAQLRPVRREKDGRRRSGEEEAQKE
jgi:hypothetical protein